MMRRTGIISALLILTLASSASACTIGMGSPAADSCERRAPRLAGSPKVRAVLVVAHRPCGSVLKSLPAHCNIRGLMQFQFLAFREVETGSPLRIVTGRVAIPSGPATHASSVGLPETDRGPPSS